MPTIRQIEAFYWSAQLGTMAAAAERLNTTQSNLSKRVLEMELRLGVELFDRSRRSIRLTGKGREILDVVASLLTQHRALVRLCQENAAYEGEFRLGVLESVGLTWLPALISALNARFPRMSVHPEINTTVNLVDRLQNRLIDLAVVTDTGALTNEMRSVELAGIEIALFGAPDRVKGLSPLSLTDLERLPIIAHSQFSGMQKTLDAFMRRRGISLDTPISSNSLSVTIHLASSGSGYVFLPRGVQFPDLARGLIREVPMAEPLPTIHYVAAFRKDDLTALSSEVSEIAADVCDFSMRL